MKTAIKAGLRLMGLQVRRIRPPYPAGSAARPLAEIRYFLEDVKARAFVPAGILDVGANQGGWTRMAHDVFPGTPAILIEPQIEMVPFLSALCAARSSCEFVHAGAGATTGELIQTIWDDLAGSSFLPEISDSALTKGTQRRTTIVTIDSLLADPRRSNFRPDLVKLDVQGFELEVLKGARSLFGRTELFILETSLFPFLPNQPLTREVIAFMAERDYELYDITEYLRRPYDGALGQVDLAFVKRHGFFRASNRWS
jgi:FkbM family methyltransferase